MAHQPSDNRLPYDYDPAQRVCTVRNARHLPDAIFAIADDIEILDASFGQLDSLPDRLGDLRNLRVAFFSHNDFQTVPAVLSACPNLAMVGFKSCKISRLEPGALPAGLRGLILTDNHLTALPEAIGTYTQLQKLMLTGNALNELPQSLLGCRSLELLRLSMNQLSQAPDWLFDLPKLAWYSDTRNPFHASVNSATVSLDGVPWEALKIGSVIGQSAKNTVYRAEYNGQPVALKVFGTGVTTDGAPADDMQASLLAGGHPNTIGGTARVIGAPDGQEGLLMPLVPADYTPLGQPPDFITLTRDIFPAQSRFSPARIARVAADIASALSYLAGQGIQHGDVYAHNILTRPDGRSYIGDFGAASRYAAGTAAGRQRERLDVRGFGYLLDDLLRHSDGPAPAALRSLRDSCLDDRPAARPTFADIISSRVLVY